MYLLITLTWWLGADDNLNTKKTKFSFKETPDSKSLYESVSECSLTVNDIIFTLDRLHL